MKIIFTLLFMLNFVLMFGQSFIHPSLPSDEITGIHYLNDLEVIFINAGGSIYKSYDGGITWQLKEYYSDYFLTGIQFLDDKIGFVRSKNYSLIYTNDGGETWDESEVSAYPSNSLLPVTQSILLKTVSGTIQRLDNFYNSWQMTFSTPTFVDSGGDVISTKYYGTIGSLVKLNNGNILALGTNENAFGKGILTDSISYILESLDQGLTWDTLWIGLKQEITDFTFVNDSTGWMMSPDSVFKSTDGGLKWDIQNVIYDGSGYKYLNAKGNNVYILNDYNRLIESTDGGKNWSTRNLDVFSFSSVVFNNTDNGFLFGEALERTTNGGQSWMNLTPDVRSNITDLKFISPKEGIALGYYGTYKTYDGGYTWTPKLHKEGDAGAFKMFNDSLGWLIKHDSIYRTTDKGETWKNVSFYDPNQLYNLIDFYGDHLGILTTSEESNPGSRIYDINNSYITTNGGITWQKRPLDSLYFIRIKFSNSTHLWGTNHYGLWLSTDTAKTWKIVYPSTQLNQHTSFDFSDSGFGVISMGDLIVTTDEGTSWKYINRENPLSGQDCKLIGRNYFGEYRVLECGKGKIILTYLYPNGEVDFSYQVPTNTSMSLNTIDIFVEGDFPDVWIAGDGFSVLYRQFERLYVSVDESLGKYELNYALLQNYPNPFNPKTTISYSIPHSNFVKLNVFDILGKEIAILVNEEKPAGNYKVVFNGSNLSSGVYFYRIQTGSFVSTKKFVLMK